MRILKYILLVLFISFTLGCESEWYDVTITKEFSDFSMDTTHGVGVAEESMVVINNGQAANMTVDIDINKILTSPGEILARCKYLAT